MLRSNISTRFWNFCAEGIGRAPSGRQRRSADAGHRKPPPTAAQAEPGCFSPRRARWRRRLVAAHRSAPHSPAVELAIAPVSTKITFGLLGVRPRAWLLSACAAVAAGLLAQKGRGDGRLDGARACSSMAFAPCL